MKILLTIILSFMISLGTLQEKVDNFNSTCNEGYEYYLNCLEKDESTYYLRVNFGGIGDEVSYSFCFLSLEANEYTLKIIQDNKNYDLPSDDRGDYFVYRLVTEKNIELGIYKENILTDHIVVNLYQKSDILSMDSVLHGEGKGLNATNLNGNNLNITPVLAIIFSSIIIICIIIILVLSILKKGWFNKKNRQATITQYATAEVEVVEETVTEPFPKSNTEKPHFEEDDRDISLILQAKGFNTDYANLEMTEKNKIMLELMRMKDFKEISESEYRSEVIKLWS